LLFTALFTENTLYQDEIEVACNPYRAVAGKIRHLTSKGSKMMSYQKDYQLLKGQEMIQDFMVFTVSITLLPLPEGHPRQLLLDHPLRVRKVPVIRGFGQILPLYFDSHQSVDIPILEHLISIAFLPGDDQTLDKISTSLIFLCY
jgi:hypothetical protein